MMARVLDTDPTTGDLALSDDRSGFRWATGAEAAARTAEAYLRTVRGEWILDAAIGVPYFARVTGAGYVPRRIRREVRKALLEVPGVVEVGPVSISINANREATITAVARHSSGEVVTIEVGQ